MLSSVGGDAWAQDEGIWTSCIIEPAGEAYVFQVVPHYSRIGTHQGWVRGFWEEDTGWWKKEFIKFERNIGWNFSFLDGRKLRAGAGSETSLSSGRHGEGILNSNEQDEWVENPTRGSQVLHDD